MSARETARHIADQSARAAAETRAFRRGNVDGYHDDGRPIVIFPNGARLLVRDNVHSPVSLHQPVQMIRQGLGLEIFARSPYQGGLGAPFTPPEP